MDEMIIHRDSFQTVRSKAWTQFHCPARRGGRVDGNAHRLEKRWSDDGPAGAEWVDHSLRQERQTRQIPWRGHLLAQHRPQRGVLCQLPRRYCAEERHQRSERLSRRDEEPNQYRDGQPAPEGTLGRWPPWRPAGTLT